MGSPMKKLCEPDKRSKSFGITPDFLRGELRKIAISDKVPGKIKAMIEFAKKICLYAYYEYDFYTLSLIYSSLLIETAIKERFLLELPTICHLKKKGKQKKVTKSYNIIYRNLAKGWEIVGFENARSLASIIQWLNSHDILPNRINSKQIESFIEIRNTSAHLDSHYINLPTMVIPAILRMFDFVNCLYDRGVHDKEPGILNTQLESQRRLLEQFRKIGEEIRKHKDKLR